MKESREQLFLKVVANVKDEAYQRWLLENKTIFITRPRTQKKAYLEALSYEERIEEGLEGIEIYKGEIYFADLDPKNSGKIRPVLIWQNDKLNRAVTLGIYHSIIVIPLSSRLYGGAYRYHIQARDNLPKTSELVCNAIGLVGSNRLMSKKGLLTKLDNHEIEAVHKILAQVMG